MYAHLICRKIPRTCLEGQNCKKIFADEILEGLYVYMKFNSDEILEGQYVYMKFNSDKKQLSECVYEVYCNRDLTDITRLLRNPKDLHIGLLPGFLRAKIIVNR